ncbi:MAG: metallophosphoesterase family protein [Clostridia bacterium]|nr:metallophosphoesterase family protein [Clostridia bacterium]
MKTLSKRFLSVVLAALIAVTAFVPSFAAGDLLWSASWEKEYENGVVLFPGSDNSEMNVSWYSKTESEPKVVVSENISFSGETETFKGYSVETADGDFSNKVTITGLEAGETYFYKCYSEGFESSLYSFSTDENENEFTALYMTDIHISHIKDEKLDDEELKRTAGIFNDTLNEAYLKHSPSILLSTGDQASDGLESEYKGLVSPLLLKKMPIATTIGNHDRKGVAYKTFTNMPNEQKNSLVSSYIGENYWFRKGDVLFLVMDSNNGSGIDHRNFVKNAVKENSDAKWKVMMAHHDLYSGRIPHRESENELLRMIWGPIADEFGIDLVLLGHSHYYTVSNVLYNGKCVAPYSAEMTNNEGTVYMVSGSITRPRDDSDLGLNEDWVGYANIPDERIIYNVLDFAEDSITVSSYYTGENTAFNSYKIVKTSNDGGHPETIIPSPFDSLVRFIGTVYAWFNNIGVYSDLKEDGFEVDFFEAVF